VWCYGEFDVMNSKMELKGSLSAKVIRADGTVEERGMIYSTSGIDRLKMWIKKNIGD
jgi:ribosomal protein S25